MKATENFRKNLQRVLSARHLSQRKVAKDARLSYPYLNRILRGKATPAIDICDVISDAVGLSLGDLLSSPREFIKKHNGSA